MAISGRDLRQVVRFLQHAGDAPDGDPFARPMLQELGALISADLVEYFEIRQRDRLGLAYATSHDLADDAPGVIDAFEAFRHQNPMGAFRWTPGAGALRLSSVLPRRELHRLDFYQSFLRPSRIRDQLKVWLRRSPESAVCISLDRSDGSFSERDAAVLEVLQPHLRVLHDARRLERGASRAGDEVTLTRREAQVLTCVLAGHRTSEVAEMLVISPHTARKHLEHAYAKLGVHGRAEAAALLLGLDTRPDGHHASWVAPVRGDRAEGWTGDGRRA
jgi:DNA-binding CsgD family transcriptional regulator